MSLIMSQAFGPNHSSRPLSPVLNRNEVKKETINMSARDKVGITWMSSWKSISGDSPPTTPIAELPLNRIPLKAKLEATRINKEESLEINANNGSNAVVNGITDSITNTENTETVADASINVSVTDVSLMLPNKSASQEQASNLTKNEEPLPAEEERPRKRQSKTGSKRGPKKKKPVEVSTANTTSVVLVNNPYLNTYQNFLENLNLKVPDPPASKAKALQVRKPLSDAQKMAKKLRKTATNCTEGQRQKLTVMRLSYKKAKSLNVKIKINRTRPLVVKELIEQKSFLDFCTRKFQSVKEGVPFIQSKSCNDTIKENGSLDLNRCLDCTYDKKNSNTQTCRFFQYRSLILKDGNVSVYGFAEEMKATFDDHKIWLPTSEPKDLDELSARHLITFVGQQFCKIFKEEGMAEQVIAVTWKKPVKGIRELCDICETTIFNTHYVCPKCGLAVCIDCYSSRRKQTWGQTGRKNRDEFGWLLCSDKEAHDITTFHLARYITSSLFASVNNAYHSYRNSNGIIGLCCDRLRELYRTNLRDMCAQQDIKILYPLVPRQWFSDDRLLLFLDPKCNDNLKLFQIYWLRGFPVMIQNVNTSLDSKLWLPSNFNSIFGKECSRLVNCMNGLILPKQPMSNFWDGFEDVDKRLIDPNTNEEMILKLKDWPPNAEFRDKLPRWFDDLMDALPLKEYTRYNGKRNLASRLPDFFVRPDLGPKMYCAFGSVLHPEKGTTNLHLDMSDAVNVMIYVGIAQRDGIPLESHVTEANNVLLKGGCDKLMMARANEDGRKVGALWHIWKAEDADKIRQFLYKVSKERQEKIDTHADPIHDQSWYLDQNLRTRLELEYNVKGVAIAQCLGDAILVPAGAPHQVQNIHSCIKVAGEFVSPENVAHCLAMTQQFRNLSKRHNNHEDKLQIKNIIYHTIKDCLFVIMPKDQLPQRPRSPVYLPPPISKLSLASQNPGDIEPTDCPVENTVCDTPHNTIKPIETSLSPMTQPSSTQMTMEMPATPQDSSSEFDSGIDETLKTNFNITEEVEQKAENLPQPQHIVTNSIPESNGVIPTELEATSTPASEDTSIHSGEATAEMPTLTCRPPSLLPLLPSVEVSSAPTDEFLPPPPRLRPFSYDSDSEANCDLSKSSSL